MRVLIVEDDSTSSRLLEQILSPYGDIDVVENGQKAVDAFREALTGGIPYNLVCMDIMMPEMDGQEALKAIRALERENGVVVEEESKVVMTTALDDPKNVVEAYYKGGATSYVPKPIDRQVFLQLLKNLGAIA